jgi:hypothetical protein
MLSLLRNSENLTQVIVLSDLEKYSLSILINEFDASSLEQCKQGALSHNLPFLLVLITNKSILFFLYLPDLTRCSNL